MGNSKIDYDVAYEFSAQVMARLNEQCTAAGLKLADIVEACGFSRANTFNWNAARGAMPLYVFARVCVDIGADPTEMLTGNPSTSPKPRLVKAEPKDLSSCWHCGYAKAPDVLSTDGHTYCECKLCHLASKATRATADAKKAWNSMQAELRWLFIQNATASTGSVTKALALAAELESQES